MKAENLLITDLADYVATVINGFPRDPREGPLVVALGGYPCIGKTTLANTISTMWTFPSFVLPTESVIRNRSERLALGYDGSSLKSHDMSALVTAINTIRSGGVIRLPQYSWLTGDFAGFHQNPILRESSLLLVDGSVATTGAVLPLVDAAFALRPEKRDAWIEMATARDVADRNWTFTMAFRENEYKAQTVDEQLAAFGRGENEYLLTVSL